MYVHVVSVLRDMLNVIVFLDDILTEHVAHLRLVLHHLLNQDLYVKSEECEFHKTELAFLSYHICPQGVGMEAKKGVHHV